MLLQTLMRTVRFFNIPTGIFLLKAVTFCLCLLLSGLGRAQSVSGKIRPSPRYEHLFKTLPTIYQNDPEWVHLMYGASPNYYDIIDAYESYYRDHVFEKNTHTQNFKHFARIVESQGYVQQDGTIYIPVNNEKKQKLFPSKRIASSSTSRAVSTSNASSAEAWIPIGPFETYWEGESTTSLQTNITAIDPSVTNPEVVYAGSETSALFKSTDAGNSWTSVGDNVFDGNGEIRAIRVDPTNEHVVYAAYYPKLLKSSDGGSTWQTLLSGGILVHSIEVNPVNPEIVFIAGAFGFKKSADGGLTWDHILSDACWDMQLKADDPNTIFLAKHNPQKKITEIHKSTDGGVSFSLKNSGWFSPIGGVAEYDVGAKIAVTEADPNRVYVVLLGEEDDEINDQNFIGIYRSDDAAETWYTPYDGNNDGVANNEPGGPYSADHWCLSCSHKTGGYNQGFYNLAIAASDTDPNSFLVGQVQMYKSDDGGVTYTHWGLAGCPTCPNPSQHVDIQDIEINGNYVWVASDGGIDLYDDNGFAHVSPRNTGINGSDFWGFDQGWNHDVLVGGKYHNGNSAYYQTYGLGNFLHLNGAESATGYVNKGENRKVYHSDAHLAKEIPETLTGSSRDIPNFSLYPNESRIPDWRSETVNDPRYWNTLYMGKDNKLWKAEDGGQNFILVHEFGTTRSDIVMAIEVSRKDPDILFLTQKKGRSSGRLWKTTDGGDTWVDVKDIPERHNNMHLSLNAENELFLVVENHRDNKIFKSSDLGLSWENLTTSALDGVIIRHIHVQDGTNGGVYIASDRNIWYRNNMLEDWQEFSSNLPVHFRINRILPFYRDGKLRVAGNRGIWEREFYEPSAPIAQPMVSSKTRSCNESTIQFEDYSILNHNNASWEWSFPGASTVSSTTVRNPLVTYDNPGNYEVTLTVTNDQGTDTKTVSNMFNRSDCAAADAPKALQCIDNGDYGINTSVNETGITNFSFTGWVKPDGVQNDFSAIFSLSAGPPVERYSLNFREGNNTLGFHWRGAKDRNWDSNLIVPTDQWSYVAMTVSPTRVTLYVNEEKATLDRSSLPMDITRIIIGSFYQFVPFNYSGLIDETTFWKKTLTDEEIWLSRHLTQTDLTDPDLLAYYQFDAYGVVEDKKNDYDLLLIEGTDLTTSDVPAGQGTSAIVEVSDGGFKAFPGTSMGITLANVGRDSEDKVVVTKIDADPSALPGTHPLVSSYWIINTYGVDNSFSSIENMLIEDLSGSGNLSAEDVHFFTRGRNSGAEIDWSMGKIASSVGGESVSFDNPGFTTGNNMQIFLGAAVSLTPLADFITLWKTNTDNQSITIPTNDQFDYNYIVDWGDGLIETGMTGDATHEYATADTYEVKISGEFPQIDFSRNPTSRRKIVDVKQWGNIKWASMRGSFYRCDQLNITAPDAPDLSQVTSMSGMFFNATTFNGSIGHWNTSNITDMSGMFVGAASFNQPLENWDVSNVKYMHGFLEGASAFNQPLDEWDVSNVEKMEDMFHNASAFNQYLGSWTSNAVNRIEMFNNSGMDCESYSATLIGWVANTTITGVTLGANDLQYGTNAEGAVTELTGNRGWTITGHTFSGEDCFGILTSHRSSHGSLNLLVFPNPSANNMTIQYNSPEPGNTKMYVYDMAGHLVKILMDEFVQADETHKVIFNEWGEIPNGSYILMVETLRRMTFRRLLINK